MGSARLDALEDERGLHGLLRTLLRLEGDDPRADVAAAMRSGRLEVAECEAEPSQRFRPVINARTP